MYCLLEWRQIKFVMCSCIDCRFIVGIGQSSLESHVEMIHTWSQLILLVRRVRRIVVDKVEVLTDFKKPCSGKNISYSFITNIFVSMPITLDIRQFGNGYHKVNTQQSTISSAVVVNLRPFSAAQRFVCEQVRSIKSFKLVVLSNTRREIGFSGRSSNILACNSHFFGLTSFAVRFHFKESVFCFNFFFGDSVLQHEAVPSIWILAPGVSMLPLSSLVSGTYLSQSLRRLSISPSLSLPILSNIAIISLVLVSQSIYAYFFLLQCSIILIFQERKGVPI